MAAPTVLRNDFIRLDAAGESLATHAMIIDRVVWHSGDGLSIILNKDFELQDTEGNIICGKRAESNGDGGTWEFKNKRVQGIKLGALDAGVVDIYIHSLVLLNTTV